MVTYKEANDYQKAGFNRILYGFALIIFVMFLALNRWLRMDPWMNTIDMQLIVGSGGIMMLLASRKKPPQIRAPSLNYWIMAESIRNVIRALGKSDVERLLVMKVLRTIGISFSVVALILVSLVISPLMIIEAAWSQIRARLS